MNAIVPLAESLPATVPAESAPLAGSLLNFVARAMADPSVNVDKLEVLLRMQREIAADDARLQFNRAMSLAQGEMQPVPRDAANDQTKSKYARLETIDAAVRPVYTRHGFCLAFNSEPASGDGPNGQAAGRTDVPTRIVCEVSHIAGHTKKYQLEAAPDIAGPQGRANKTPLHGLGSTISYLRRYLTCMIFNVALANDDNDGNRWRPEAEISSRTRIDELYALLAECSADPNAVAANERAFLTRMNLGHLRSLADAPAGDFPRLRNALVTKKSILAQRQTSNINAKTGAAA